MEVNLIGRTKIEQDKVELECNNNGSLWPKLECLHLYEFTTKELINVRNAYKTIKDHNEKKLMLIK